MTPAARRGVPSRAHAAVTLGALLFAAVVACQGELRLDDTVVDAGIDASPSDGASSASSADGAEAAPPHPDAHPDEGPTPRCTTDSDCKLSALHCDTTSGTCVQCVADADCAGGADKRCDAALHQCVQCGVDGDCPSGQVCYTQTARCVTSCQSITDCVLSGSLCDVTRDICIRCVTDAMCDLYPSTPKCAADGSCVACTSDSDCSGSTPVCDQVDGSCVACVASSDCPAVSPLCDPSSNTCTSG